MGETSFRSPLIWSFLPFHFLCVSHFIQWETPPPFRNPFCPSPCDFPLLSPPFKRTQIVFVNGNCRQKRQAKWILWRGILLFNPSPQSLPCSIERERKENYWSETLSAEFSFGGNHSGCYTTGSVPHFLSKGSWEWRTPFLVFTPGIVQFVVF